MYLKVITPFDLPGSTLTDFVLTTVVDTMQFYNPMDDFNGYFGSVHIWFHYQISGVNKRVKLGIF